jgi:6-phosphogluconate dehydrogenase
MIGVVGLGRMGGAVAQRLVQDGHAIIGFDVDPAAVERVKAVGAQGTTDLAELAAQVDVVWLMVPAGEIVDQTIAKLLPHMQKGATIIDAGNSLFANSIRRSAECRAKGIKFLDCGTSGGVHGLEHGFCLMVGGSKEAYQKFVPYFKSIAAPDGFAHVGPVGAGNYIKTIHNGVEYALLQSYAEGFDLMKNNDVYPDLDLEQIAKLWQHGSVIRSFILELAQNVFAQDQELKNVKSIIGGGQTGRWTVAEAKAQNIPMPLIEHTLKIRQVSRAIDDRYAAKLVAMLRNQFGGHAVEQFDEDN